MVDDDSQLGREPGGLGGPVADDRRRRDHERRAAAGACGRGGRAPSASCRGPCRARGNRRARRRRGSRARPAPRPGSCGARRRSPRAGVIGSVGTVAALSSRSVAQPLPSTTTPPRERRALQADAWPEDLGAGELVVVGPLGERGGRLFQVDLVELDPPAARAHERTGLGGETGDLGRGRARRRRTPPTTARCSAGGRRRRCRRRAR